MIDFAEIIVKHFENIYGANMIRSVKPIETAKKAPLFNVMVRTAPQSEQCAEMVLNFEQLVQICKAYTAEPKPPENTTTGN